MKKIILSITAAATLATAANAQVGIAPELGLNMANMSVKSAGASMSTSMKAGLAVGANFDFGFSDNLYLQPGIFYLMNGANFSGGSYNVSTIEVPINLEYKLGEPGDNRFFFGVGPYIGYNVSGKIKAGSTSVSMEIGTDKAKDDLKPMDVGAGLNVCYLLANGLYFRAHYQLGFTNLVPGGDADNSAKTSALGITVGYYLAGNKGKKGK